MARSLLWDITYECNLCCSHCYNKQRVINRKLPLIYSKKISDIVFRISLLGVTHVHLLGGEPLIATNFTEIVKELHEKNIQITINTNGTLLNSKLLFCLLPYIAQITISLDGANSFDNDRIRGNGNFILVQEKLKLIADMVSRMNAKVKINVATVLNRNSFKNIYQLPQLLTKIGISRLMILQIYDCSDSGVDYNELNILPEEYISSIIKLLYTSSKYGVQLFLDCKPLALESISKLTGYQIEKGTIYNKCQAGKQMLYMDAYGEVYPCSPMSHECDKEYFNIWDKELESNLVQLCNWVKKNQKYYISNPVICKQCHYRSHCTPCILCSKAASDVCLAAARLVKRV